MNPHCHANVYRITVDFLLRYVDVQTERLKKEVVVKKRKQMICSILHFLHF